MGELLELSLGSEVLVSAKFAFLPHIHSATGSRVLHAQQLDPWSRQPPSLCIPPFLQEIQQSRRAALAVVLAQAHTACAHLSPSAHWKIPRDCTSPSWHQLGSSPDASLGCCSPTTQEPFRPQSPETHVSCSSGPKPTPPGTQSTQGTSLHNGNPSRLGEGAL